MLGRLLVEDSGLLLLSLHLLGNSGFVPEAVEMGERSDDDEDDTEVNLSDEKVLLKSNPFTDWGPLQVTLLFLLVEDVDGDVLKAPLSEEQRSQVGEKGGELDAVGEEGVSFVLGPPF